MTILNTVVVALVTIVVAPVIGGTLTGLDRKISARLQNRQGPPIRQPFYDLFKLLAKEPIAVNRTQMVYVLGYLLFAIASLLMLALRQDLLMLFFVLAFSNVWLIMGAMSVPSPYSRIGAQREIIQMLAYEPLLLLLVVGVYLTTRSFTVTSVLNHGAPLLYSLPLVFLVFLVALAIKLRKSPFDFSASHHGGHQELVRGITTEFSGPQLALIELTHWYELGLLLGLITLFVANPLWVGVLLALASYLLEIVLDNVTARVTWGWMLRMTWLVGLGAAMTNIIWLYLPKL